uniref:Uncharacterized protein n=1 Tax=Anguilla anguilla TaxID=7936 RepID=A0A0E9UX43_ANGAN
MHGRAPNFNVHSSAFGENLLAFRRVSPPQIRAV